MSDHSKIEWCDATWNPVGGCSKISPGCAGCYAIPHVHRMAGNPNPKIRAANEGLTRTLPNGRLDWTGVVRLIPARLMTPVLASRPRKYFVNSLSDLFHENLPFDDVDAVVAAMVYAKAVGRDHVFQVLTKRSERLLAYLSSRGEDPEFIINGAYRHFGDEAACAVANSIAGVLGAGRNVSWPLSNVWWGVSVEDQKHGLPRVDHLRAAAAHVRILSIEPMLEDLGTIDLSGIHQVIMGGESGHRARPMHPAWVRSLRDQCIVAGVAFFFKQWGEWTRHGSVDAYTAPGGQRNFPTARGIAWLADGRVCLRDFTVAEHAERVRAGVATSARAIEVDDRGGLAALRASWNRADAAAERCGHARRGGPCTAECDEAAAASDRLGLEWMYCVGKKRAGRSLDGRTWDEFRAISPEVR
jgi:protein gp37